MFTEENRLGGKKLARRTGNVSLGTGDPELSGGAAGVGPAVPLTHSSPEASNKSIAPGRGAWSGGAQRELELHRKRRMHPLGLV